MKRTIITIIITALFTGLLWLWAGNKNIQIEFKINTFTPQKELNHGI